MVNVSDSFLLQIAGISASLLGFFVVGVFFYVERSIFPQAAEEAGRYLKAAVRSVIYLYGMATLLSLGLVALTSRFASVLYLLLSVGLVWSVAHTNAATRRLQRAVGVRVLSHTFTWVATSVILGLPWVVGGLAPSRSDFTWGLIFVGVLAFISTTSFVLSAFDLSALEASTFVGERSDADPKLGDQPEVESERSRGSSHVIVGLSNGGKMKKGDTRRQGGWLDGRFAEFDRRLKGILGGRRIPRQEKEAKAERAMLAVDDLIEGITDDISQIEK